MDTLRATGADGAVADLLAFIDASPTPYHAAREVARRLDAAGFSQSDETELWELEPGARRYVVRNDGSLAAFQIGSESPVEAGFRIVGAHTDSPNLRLKPMPDVVAHGYRQLAVEPYGGLLLHTWLDRDLSLAGRVSVREAGSLRSLLLCFGRPLLRIPSLAIHLYRELPKEGLLLNEQTHAVPLAGLESAPALGELLATELRAQRLADVRPEAIVSFDLMLHDAQPAAVAGARGEFILAPRLDNLAMCHAATSALLRAQESPGAATRVIVFYDHEEVGSGSAHGARGTLLEQSLERVVAGFKGGAPQGTARAVARSTLVSADMAHAVHPNYAERHEPHHRPVLGRGPVIKTNANQAYASDSVTAGTWSAMCADLGFAPQHFVTRSDLPCGSTIGPISAARVGLRTVDVGNPMLSMHSCREMAATADVEPMIRALASYFAS